MLADIRLGMTHSFMVRHRPLLAAQVSGRLSTPDMADPRRLYQHAADMGDGQALGMLARVKARTGDLDQSYPAEDPRRPGRQCAAVKQRHPTAIRPVSGSVGNEADLLPSRATGRVAPRTQTVRSRIHMRRRRPTSEFVDSRRRSWTGKAPGVGSPNGWLIMLRLDKVLSAYIQLTH